MYKRSCWSIKLNPGFIQVAVSKMINNGYFQHLNFVDMIVKETTEF
jgi:hypothetical protein